MSSKDSVAKWLVLKVLRIGLLLALFVLVTLVAVFLAALVLDSLQFEGGRGGQLVRDVSYGLISGAPGFLAGLWILFFGSALGSFMNVVVYRMPLGKSVTTRASHCPRCQTPILARDNIPVIGWIMLNGRCRACRLPISSRYPIVEAVSGLMVFGLVVSVLLLPAPNFPAAPGEYFLRFGLTADFFATGMAQRFLLQSLVLLTILCSALIRWDKNLIPVKLVLFAFVAVGAGVIAFPAAVPVAAWPPGIRLDEAGSPGSWAIIGQVFFAGAIGVLIGAIAAARLRSPAGKSFALSMDCAMGLGLLGIVLGWQHALAIGLVLAIALSLARVVGKQSRDDRPSRMFLLLAIAFAGCMLWGYIDTLPIPIPGSSTPLWELPVWLVPLLLPMMASWIERHPVPLAVSVETVQIEEVTPVPYESPEEPIEDREKETDY